MTTLGTPGPDGDRGMPTDPPGAVPPPRRPLPVPGVEARNGRFRGPSLIPELQAIQSAHGWLPREELTALSRRTDRPLYEIQGLVSFYPSFRTEPPPAVRVDACHDLPCWLAGSEAALTELHETYGDAEDVSLTEVSCLGRCDSAPAVAVNDQPGTVHRTAELVTAVRDARPSVPPVRDGDAPEPAPATTHGAAPDVAPPPRATAPRPNDPYATGQPRYQVLRSLLAGELETADIIATLEDAQLRGMGGAGFPTGTKWKIVAGQDAEVTYVICNADESEPGTFKDRQILAEQPHLVLEGMLIGMVVVGAEEGIVFIRHEYGPEEEILRAELEQLRTDGLLGDGVAGTDRRLDIDIFTSPGGYILGEETALIECLEGHRGEPRNKPPFPGEYGLWGQPTLMNSVETFAHVPIIVRRGASWWRGQGVNGATGLKFFAVSGDVAEPGVHCVALGTSVGALIELAGGMRDGTTLGAVQPGGASSNFLGPDRLELPLAFDSLTEAGTMLGSGAVVAVAEGTDLLAAATNVLRFFRDESCGKCVPCRVGSTKAHTSLREVLDAGEPLDGARRERIVELEAVMRRTSICGLGQVALGPVISVLERSRG